MTGYQSKKKTAQDKLDSMEREALKLALEVLLDIIEGSRLDFAGNRNDDGLIDHNGNHDFKNRINNAYAAINKLKKTLAQPAQEPVAFEEWLSKQHGDPEEIGFLQALRIAYISGQDSIITPPQRTWVEPTGNEWFEWWRISKVADATEAEIDFADFLIIAQAVSAKLKERK